MLQVIPQLIEEIPHMAAQDRLGIGFQAANAFGFLAAIVSIFFLSQMHTLGWMCACAIMLGPLLLCGSSFLIPESPISLVIRGSPVKAIFTLQKIRGSVEVEEEFRKIIAATAQQKNLRSLVKEFFRPTSRPIGFTILVAQFSQLFSGAAMIIFFAPVLFKSLGYSSNATFISSLSSPVANIVGCLSSTFMVNMLGRRRLLIVSFSLMCFCQVLLSCRCFNHVLQSHTTKTFLFLSCYSS